MRKMMSLALALSVLACSPGATLAGTLDIDAPAARTETRVYTRRQCLLSESALVAEPQIVGAIASIFVPLLVSRLFGGVSAALNKAAADETLRDSGRLPTYLYQLALNEDDEKKLSLNPNLKCVVVVRGTFSGPDPRDQAKVAFPDAGVLDVNDEGSYRKRIRRLNESNIHVTSIAAA